MANTYKSKFEARMAKVLEDAKIPFKYESVRLPFTLVLKRKYLPDFVLDNGIFIETKGKFTSDDRRKHLQIKKEHPQLDIRFVFMADNKLSKKSKTRYSDWCKENGFKYSVGYIPKEWLHD